MVGYHWKLEEFTSLLPDGVATTCYYTLISYNFYNLENKDSDYVRCFRQTTPFISLYKYWQQTHHIVQYTVPPKYNITWVQLCMIENSLKSGCGTHFDPECLALDLRPEDLQSNWMPSHFLTNCMSLHLCSWVQHCIWIVPYVIYITVHFYYWCTQLQWDDDMVNVLLM